MRARLQGCSGRLAYIIADTMQGSGHANLAVSLEHKQGSQNDRIHLQGLDEKGRDADR